MSAIAVVTGSDGIIVVSDGVCYDYDTGDVGGYTSKIIIMPEYSAFIASTGMGAFGAALRYEFNQSLTCFDDLVGGFEDTARDVHRRLCNRGFFFDKITGREAEVSCVIGGWSDRAQAYEVYRLASFEKESKRDEGDCHLDPFKMESLSDLGSVWCSSLPDNLHEFGLAPPPEDMESIDIAVRLICANRATSGFHDGDKEEPGRHYNVGGFLQITTIQRDHIQSWIPHRWPEDEIGKPIDPTKGERIPSWRLAA